MAMLTLSPTDMDRARKIDESVKPLSKVWALSLGFVPAGLLAALAADAWTALWVLGVGFLVTGLLLAGSARVYSAKRMFRKLTFGELLKPVPNSVRTFYALPISLGLTSAATGVAGLMEHEKSLTPSRSGDVAMYLMIAAGAAILPWPLAALWKNRGAKAIRISKQSLTVFPGNRRGESTHLEYPWASLREIRFRPGEEDPPKNSSATGRGVFFEFLFIDGVVTLPPERYGISPRSIIHLLDGI